MYEVVTFGRSSIDLYSNDVGRPFHQIRSFNAYVGGSSTNIAVGCARLGLRTGLISAVGRDKVGEFIMHFLRGEGIDTSFVFEKTEGRSSAVLLGVEPPDKFPLVYYRENAADILINNRDVQSIPIDRIRNLVISGTALSRDPSRSAVFDLLVRVNPSVTSVVLDLDYRHDQWDSIDLYQEVIDSVIEKSALILGTEEEVLTAADPEVKVTIHEQQISAPLVEGKKEKAINNILSGGDKTLIVKTGRNGARLYSKHHSGTVVPGFPVEVLNVLGAGDAFAAGLLYGKVNNWDLVKSTRFANGCGAYIVTQHGCANFNPTLSEIQAFIEQNGGF